MPRDTARQANEAPSDVTTSSDIAAFERDEETGEFLTEYHPER